MLDPNDPLVQLKITCATCSLFAFATTIYRLHVRRDRLWADDLGVLFAGLALVVQVVAVFLHLPIPNNLSQTARVAAYYLMATTFYAIIWGSRLSILFSLVRVDPSAERRQRLIYVAYAFILALLVLLAQLLWVCEPEPSWKDTANPQCKLSLQVAILQLVTDIIADSILLLAPIPLFRNLSDKPLRRKLTLIFSTCVVTTIVSLVHAVYILNNGGIKVVISALVEDSLSLIVANIPVLVTSLFDITGDLDHDNGSTFLQFSTMPWFNGTTGTHTQNTLSTGTSSDEGAPTTVNLRTLRRYSRSRQSRGDAFEGKSWKDVDRDVDVEFDADNARSPTTLLRPSRTVAFADDSASVSSDRSLFPPHPL
ncbi:hypothetical protein C8F01DRAFT_744462 [Mycena amicta]|nr:hypothetical protein C8F01DRAFT_744462 [Mycena amicta]